MLIRFSLRKVAVAAALNFVSFAFEGEVDLSSPFSYREKLEKGSV